MVGGETGLAKRCADRLDGLVDRCPKLAVKHRGDVIATRDGVGVGVRIGVLFEVSAEIGVGVALAEVLDDLTVDGVDEHEPTLGRWVLGRVAEHPPRRPAAQPAPDLLCRRVTDWETECLLGCDERLGLVDVHPPAARDREHADRREHAGGHQPADVDDRRVRESDVDRQRWPLRSPGRARPATDDGCCRGTGRGRRTPTGRGRPEVRRGGRRSSPSGY